MGGEGSQVVASWQPQPVPTTTTTTRLGLQLARFLPAPFPSPSSFPSSNCCYVVVVISLPELQLPLLPNEIIICNQSCAAFPTPLPLPTYPPLYIQLSKLFIILDRSLGKRRQFSDMLQLVKGLCNTILHQVL